MNLFSIDNLRATRVQSVTAPPDAVKLPAFDTKEKYRKWCEAITTEHAFVSAVEALTPSLRVNSENKPYRIYGLIADYDALPPAEPIVSILQNAPPACRPMWISKTFSGHVRAYWQFEKPVFWFNKALAEAFIKRVLRETKAKALLPGLDLDLPLDLSQYYEIGSEWEKVPNATPIPAALVEGWVAGVASKHNFTDDAGSQVIPFELLRTEAGRRFPSRWPGGWESFEPGARGVRFWDTDADAFSVIVREAGCQCFTGEKPFVSWGEIFGADWCRKATDERTGSAITGIYYDAGVKGYWRDSASTGWQLVLKEDIRLELKVAGMADTPPKGGNLSEIDRALYAIQKTKAVHGVMSAFYRKDEIVSWNSSRYLNVTRVKLMQPSPIENLEWGHGFPWLSAYLDGMLDFDGQKEFFLGWLAHFYRSALHGRTERGLATFLAGPTNAGKTFFNNAIMGQIFGSVAVATRFLTGDEPYNGELMACPVWAVDDAVASTERKSRQKFSQIVKMAVANDSISCRAMFREGTRLPWTGRIIVTMNDDAESIQMIPSTEINLLDKVNLFKVRDPNVTVWPDDEEAACELPAFCAWLRDWKMPEHVWCGGRFGVRPYHHSDLVGAAEASQDSTSLSELIEKWRTVYFKGDENGDAWEGNPTELLQAMSHVESLKDISARAFPTATVLGRDLTKLLNRKLPWLTFKREAGSGKRCYRITKGNTELEPF